MSEPANPKGITIGLMDWVVRGRIVASLRPGELTVQVVWWKPGGEARGGTFPVRIEIVEPDARIPNTPVWMDLSGEHRAAVRIWRRGEGE